MNQMSLYSVQGFSLGELMLPEKVEVAPQTKSCALQQELM